MTPTPKKKLPNKLLESFVEIIRKTSTELPQDVVDAIEAGRKEEEAESRGEYALKTIERNIGIAKVKSQPLCQDTGSVLFFVHYPYKMDHEELAKLFRKAVTAATKKGYLRQNSVDSLTGKNDGTNLGPGAPTLHLEPWRKDFFDVRLILKGGGCENVGAQYSLPDSRVGAGRDLAGVRKCILDAVQQAQGKGCGPGILGVTIGGDRATGYLHSKEQFLRKMKDKNPISELEKLEKEVTSEANALGIGPMGFGGKTTLLATKIGVLNRVPASFFVSVSYMCWAYRRQGAKLGARGDIQKWFY
jgi:fumarate hydratase class I